MLHMRFITILVLLALTKAGYGEVPVKLIVRTGTSAAGAGSGVNYGQVGQSPSISDAGQVVFDATLSGTGVTSSNDRAIFSSYSGTTSLCVREGTTAPGEEPAARFGDVYGPQAVGTNGCVFKSSLTNSTHSYAIWSKTSGTLQAIARTSDPAPGTAVGTNFNNFGNLRVNSSGKTAFYATVGSTGSSNGVWSNRSGTLQMTAPTSPWGPSLPNPSEPAINATGQLAFSTSSNGRAVYRDDPTRGLTTVAQTNGQVPGLPAGSKFNAFGSVTMNNRGQTAFCGDILGGTFGSAVWSEGSGSLQVVARSGTVAPGTSQGVNFAEFYGSRSPACDPAISSSGDVAFVGYLSGTGVTDSNDTGIWTGHAGSLRLLAREGTQVPGLPAGAIFLGLQRPMMNAAGQVAFCSQIYGGGVYNYGIFATTPAGDLVPVAYYGMKVQVSPGVFSSLTNAWAALDTMSGENGGICGFNASGQLAFWGEFTTGRGIFLATVPEPTTLLLSGIATLAILTRRRRPG